MGTDSWSVIHTTVYEAEAYLIKGYLEHNGVPCIIDSPAPFNIGEMSRIQLMVPADKEIEAERLIDIRREDSDVICDNCGARGDETDNYCRKCGASFIGEYEEEDFDDEE